MDETSEQRTSRVAPLEVLHKEPWAFAGLALAMGFAIGMLWKFKSVRKILWVYTFLHRRA